MAPTWSAGIELWMAPVAAFLLWSWCVSASVPAVAVAAVVMVMVQSHAFAALTTGASVCINMPKRRPDNGLTILCARLCALPPFSACKGALARSGYWVVVDDRFGCAVGRQVAGADAADSAYVTATVAPSFNKLLADSGWEEGRQRAVIAAYEACFGTLDSALAFTVLNSLDGRQAGKQLAAPTDTAAQWQLSTAPAAADSAAATSKQQQQQHVLQFDAASGVTRRWAVVENTHQLFSDKGSALQLAPLVYKA